jgi:hypothetical protein
MLPFLNCILTLSSRFNLATAGTGIAIPNVKIFKHYAEPLSKLGHKCEPWMIMDKYNTSLAISNMLY